MLLCNSAFEQGNLELRHYRNAFIIIIITSYVTNILKLGNNK